MRAKRVGGLFIASILAGCGGGAGAPPPPGAADGGGPLVPDGGPTGGPNGADAAPSSGWVLERPDEWFFDVHALGADLYGVGGPIGGSERHLQHRAPDGTWSDEVITLDGIHGFDHILPLAPDNLYAFEDGKQAVWHSSGNGTWTELIRAEGQWFSFLVGEGQTAYLGSKFNSDWCGIVRTSSSGGSFSNLLAIPGRCFSFVGGFAGNGVLVFAFNEYDLQTMNRIDSEILISTGGDFTDVETRYTVGAYWASSATNIHAGWGDVRGASVVHYDGTNWDQIGFGWDDNTDYVDSLAASSANDIWALTGHGRVYHFDGSTWSGGDGPIPYSWDSQALGQAIAVTGPGDVWVVVNQRLYHRR